VGEGSGGIEAVLRSAPRPAAVIDAGVRADARDAGVNLAGLGEVLTSRHAIAPLHSVPAA